MQSIMGSRGNSGATNVKHERKIMLKAGLLECSKEGRVPPRKIRKTFTTTLLPKWLCPEAPDNCLIAKLSPWGDQNFKCHFNWKSFIPRSWEFSEEHTYLLFPCVWSLKTVLTHGMLSIPGSLAMVSCISFRWNLLLVILTQSFKDSLNALSDHLRVFMSHH